MEVATGDMKYLGSHITLILHTKISCKNSMTSDWCSKIPWGGNRRFFPPPSTETGDFKHPRSACKSFWTLFFSFLNFLTSEEFRTFWRVSFVANFALEIRIQDNCQALKIDFLSITCFVSNVQSQAFLWFCLINLCSLTKNLGFCTSQRFRWK